MADVAHPDHAAIAASQLARLQTLLGVIRPANRFQTARLEAAGAPSTVASLEAFGREFPFTTKADLVADQLAHPPYGTNLTFPVERYTRFHQTSGTTGTPLRWLDTSESWEAMVEDWCEVFRAAGVTAADHVFFAFSFGPFLGFWLAYEAGQRIGLLCLPGGGLSSAARLRLILDNGATVLCCTPTYAARLAEVAAAEGIDLKQSRVRLVMVAGEAGGSIASTRARLGSLWNGARIFDHHGMTEVGPVTFECPAQAGRLHVMERSFLAEVIDPATGRPVAPGEAGELVLTNLHRAGSPLLRYRTGDLVRAGHHNPCACGRHLLSLEGGILGRVDDMVVVRGVNIHPPAVEDLVRRCGGIAEYQAVVTTHHAMTELRLRVEPEAGVAGAEVARRLERMFQDALALRVPVEAVGPGELPRFEMKAKRWVRLPA